MTIHTNRINVIAPYSDIQACIAQYLRYAGAIRDDQIVTGVILPIEVSDEDMVEMTVGILEEGEVH